MAGFVITQATKDAAKEQLDALLTQLGKPCKLVYEPTESPCNNCIVDLTTGRSSGKYNGEGPKSFTRGICPVCHGTGILPDADEVFDTVTFLINPKPKTYGLFKPDIQIPDGLVLIKGFLTDMPKLIQCKYVILNYTHAGVLSERYVRWGEPTPQGNIVQNQYFIAYLQRYGS